MDSKVSSNGPTVRLPWSECKLTHSAAQYTEKLVTYGATHISIAHVTPEHSQLINSFSNQENSSQLQQWTPIYKALDLYRHNAYRCRGIVRHLCDGFGGLVVSMLASGTRVRGFKPGRSRWIFRPSEKSSACLPSEGKWKNLSHVPSLRHVKEPSTSVNYDVLAKFLV